MMVKIIKNNKIDKKFGITKYTFLLVKRNSIEKIAFKKNLNQIWLFLNFKKWFTLIKHRTLIESYSAPNFIFVINANKHLWKTATLCGYFSTNLVINNNRGKTLKRLVIFSTVSLKNKFKAPFIFDKYKSWIWTTLTNSSTIVEVKTFSVMIFKHCLP